MSEALLELSQPRTIVLEDRNKEFVLVCRRVEDADWQKYFANIQISQQQIGDKRVTTVETQTALLALVHSVLADAIGYLTDAGAGELTTLPDWQTRLPLAHRIALGKVLAGVTLSDDQEDDIIRFETECSLLDCAWSTDEEDGKMTAYIGLKHIFCVPTIGQQKRYNQLVSKSTVTGGRNGVTTFANAQPLLCTLYDELIVEVEGYAWEGKPLEGYTTVIRASMDTMHKVVAVERLFNPQATVTTR